MFSTNGAFSRVGIAGAYRRTWTIFKKRLDLFMTLTVILYVLSVISTFSIFKIQTEESSGNQVSTGESLVVILEFFVQLIVAVIFQAAMTRATAELYLQTGPTTLDCVRHGCSLFCNLFCSILPVIFVAVIGPMILASIALALLARGGGIGRVVGFILLVLAVIVFAYIYTPFLILTPTIVVERKCCLQAIKRSWSLGTSERLFIFCAVFPLFFLSFAFASVVGRFLPDNFGGAMAKNLPILFLTPFITMYVFLLFAIVAVWSQQQKLCWRLWPF